MNTSTEQIMPNVVLTCLTTTKFKTGCLSVNLLTPLCREAASRNALIPMVLCRGTATLPDMAAISSKLDSLYGARIKPVVRKKGEIQVTGLYADFADDAFIPGGSLIVEQMSALMSEMLLMPRTHGGLLFREYVESEREKLLEQIRGRINEKRAYSMNVREKLSLCYFASSSADLHKGILAVSSGIEFDKYDAALSEILAQLEAVKRGEFSESELLAAKSAVASDYRTVEDSPAALEDFYLNQALIGPDCSPLELAALAEDIKAEEVTAIAKGVECDAIYFLRGQKEAG